MPAMKVNHGFVLGLIRIGDDRHRVLPDSPPRAVHAGDEDKAGDPLPLGCGHPVLPLADHTRA